MTTAGPTPPADDIAAALAEALSETFVADRRDGRDEMGEFVADLLGCPAVQQALRARDAQVWAEGWSAGLRDARAGNQTPTANPYEGGPG